MSESSRDAVIGVPTLGRVGFRVTVPASSTLSTVMVTATISISPPALAMTVTM